MTTVDTARIRAELLDASEHLHGSQFDCCSGHRIARTRVIDLVEALEEARAEIERLRAAAARPPTLEDRNGDVWVPESRTQRWQRNQYTSPMPREWIEKWHGPVSEVRS